MAQTGKPNKHYDFLMKACRNVKSAIELRVMLSNHEFQHERYQLLYTPEYMQKFTNRLGKLFNKYSGDY